MEPPVLQPEALQPDTDLHPVTITVDFKAKALFTIAMFGIPSQTQIDDSTQMGDGTVRSGYGSTKSDFEVTVFPGSSVTWQTALDSPAGPDEGYSIQLVDIAQESNVPNNKVFFDGMPLASRNSGVSISATTKTDTDLRNQDDTYTITFTITNPQGVVSRQITMDPKLRMNPNP